MVLFVFLLNGKDIWEGKVETREIEEDLDHFNHYETHEFVPLAKQMLKYILN